MATCSGCKATIRWIKTTAGKSMPVDPERIHEWIDTDAPSTKLPRITLITPEGETVTGHQGSILTPGARSFEGYISHFATCPQAKQFRRAGG